MRSPLFTGVCTALVTPFIDGNIDFHALEHLIDRQIEAGVSTLLVCGTTGEPSALSDDEWRAVIQHAIRHTNGKIPVIAGTGTNNLDKTLLRAQIACDLGAAAQLCVTPYYNKTTQSGLIDFFSRIADSSRLPVILYNVPARTGVNMQPATIKALSHHENIIGIKEAGGDLAQLAQILRICHLPLYCGNDLLNAPSLQLGACGLISVLSNVCPQAVVHLCANMQKGNIHAANAQHEDLLPLTEALFCEVSPIPVKAALAMMQLCSADVRPPLTSLSARSALMLRSILTQRGLMPQ